MAKDAYYFSHDSNARHDPKITAMRGVYGSEGYGWYWMFIEMMRDADGYKLDLHSKYAFNAYAMQMHTNAQAISSFINDCIHEFDLFQSDELYFWSDSLLRRMELREERSEKAKKAAEARWGKKQQDDTTHARASIHNASASIADALNEKKENKSKKKEREGKQEQCNINHVALPEHNEAIKNRLHLLVNQANIKNYNLFDLEQLYSYIGVVDVEVIEAAIKKGTNKSSLKYAIQTLVGMIQDGITKKEQLLQKVIAPANSFRSSNRKPHIPTVTSTAGEAISEEELEELRKLAKKIECGD